MKKRIILVSSILLLLALLAVYFTSAFTKSVFSGKIYRPQNVYEEIWNLVVIEECTTEQTVLTTATKNADVDFDLGYAFVGIHIPECNLSISWWNGAEDTELSFLFSTRLDGDGDHVHFVYNYETKTLFGNTEFSFLMENFLKEYFQWCDASADFSSEYSAESLGEISFQYVNPIWSRELSN